MKILPNALFGLVIGVSPGLLGGYSPFDLQWWASVTTVFSALIYRDLA
jgi:hypothetical protein